MLPLDFPIVMPIDWKNSEKRFQVTRLGLGMSTASDASRQKPAEVLPDAGPKRSFLEQLRFIKPYWVSDQKWKAWLQLGGVLALIVAEIALTAGVSLGFQAALNALVAKQALGFALTGAATLAG